MSDITGDDLREYRDVAAAFPQGVRNPENSWEVHQMLMDHPDRAELIKRTWTEESLTDYLSGERADKMIADMQAAGEITENADGTVSVNAASWLGRLPAAMTPVRRGRLAKPGEFDEYLDRFNSDEKGALHPDNVTLVHSNEPGGKPKLFPNEVLAEARADGEVWREFSRQEMLDWKNKNREHASVDLVLKYERGVGLVTTDKEQIGLSHDEAQREVTRLNERLTDLHAKSANIGSLMLASQQKGKGWTLSEIIEQLGLGAERGTALVQDMVNEGYVTQHVRRNGQHEYVLQDMGSGFYDRYLGLGGGVLDKSSPLDVYNVDGTDMSALDESLRADLHKYFLKAFGKELSDDIADDMYDAWIRAMINQRAVAIRYGNILDAGERDPYEVGAEEGISPAMVDKYLRWHADPDAFREDNWPSDTGLEEHHYTSVYWDGVEEQYHPPTFDMAKEIAHGRLDDPRANSKQWFADINGKTLHNTGPWSKKGIR